MREYGRPTTTPTTARKSPIRKPGVLEPFDRGKQVKDHDRWESSKPTVENRATGIKSLVSVFAAIDACGSTGAVAELVGIEGGVVSGVINLESSGVEAVGLETTP